jgi:DNA-binding Xre family transcriptional regulator
MTLRELWESKGLSPTQVAAQAGISTPTLYRMNQKEHVTAKTIVGVCKALGISRQDYEALDADKVQSS